MKTIARDLALAVCLLAAGQNGFAAPARCSAGYQDSTCVPALSAPWQTAPTCSNGPGWTTVAAAQWQGAYYSAPACNYQAPPTCPNGFNQTSAPSWNGSSWVGLGCAAPPPAVPSMPQLAAACASAIGSMMAGAGQNGQGFYKGQWGSWQGPAAVGGGNPYPPQFASGGFVLVGPGGGAGDFIYANDLGNPPAGGATTSNGVGMCWFQSGTSNLIGYGYAYDQGNDGG